eukprot:scaffold54948_cov49-Phaeocystis_antarctica.AAC.5
MDTCAPPRALLPTYSRALSYTLRAPRSPAASRLPTRIPRPAPHALLFRLSAGWVGVQPAAELRHLQRHEHVLHVRGALLPVPCPQPAIDPPPERCACAAVARRPPTSRPAPRRAPYALRSTLGSSLRCSTSR